jgi:AraC-like DNA-binding protein
MDILTDVFNSSGLVKSLLARRSFYEPWATRFPCAKSIGFHVVTQGEMVIRSKHLKAPIHLKRGDIAFIQRGFDHEIATDLKAKVKATVSTAESGTEPELVEARHRQPLATFVSGVYQFQTEPIHPLFAEFPKTIVLRSEQIPAHDPLNVALLLLSAELDQREPGTESITRSLLDILFNYIVRHWLNEQGSVKSSWALAIRDPQLSRALQAIHGEPSREWSVDELASVAGMSRAAFAQKFKKMTDETPARYLSRVRIQRAMDLLRRSDETIERVAEVVGYKDSFVFSKAFKRIQGQSPRDYRRAMRA